jgi:PAS domain S-box-containing protein
LGKLGITCSDHDILNILTKSHFVIPGKTRFECQQCGECCRYARKIANLRYEPCPFLTDKNLCGKHDNRYSVCKWFPFWVYNDPKYGELLTIKPYCSGFGKGPVINYHQTIKNLKELEKQTQNNDDGAFVIHELLYIPDKKEWVFPSRLNIDLLLRYISKSKGESIQQEDQSYIAEMDHAQHFSNGLLGSVTDPQVTVNEKGLITDMNDSFLTLSGQTKSNIFKKELSGIFVNSEIIKNSISQCFATGKINAVPVKLKTNGHSKNLLLNGLTYRDRKDGLVHGLLLCLKEVSDSIYYEMNQSRNYARGLLEASLDLLVVLDKEGFVSDVNQTCCDLLGKERNSIIGTSFREYFDNPGLIDNGIQITYEKGMLKNYEANLIHSGKEIIPVSFNASLFKDSEGTVKGIFASARDIREPNKLIHELEMAQNYSRSLIESNLDLMVTINPQGIITDVNKAAEMITGCSRDELIGSKFSSYFEDKDKAAQGIALAFEKSVLQTYELVLINKNLEKIDVSFNASVYKGIKNNVIGILATARDIRERLRIVRELEEIKNYSRSFIDNSFELMFMIDPQGMITDINNTVEEFLGIKRSLLIHTPITEWFLHSVEVNHLIQHTFRDGVSVDCALTVKATSVELQCRTFLYKDLSGNKTGVRLHAVVRE